MRNDFDSFVVLQKSFCVICVICGLDRFPSDNPRSDFVASLLLVLIKLVKTVRIAFEPRQFVSWRKVWKDLYVVYSPEQPPGNLVAGASQPSWYSLLCSGFWVMSDARRHYRNEAADLSTSHSNVPSTG